MGVATSNSILVVTFAREQLEILVGDARRAALNAGFVRLRPVVMTALAMIIGMVPMSLGLGRRRRTERAPGPRGDWWIAAGHRGYAVFCSRILFRRSRLA